MGELVGIIQVCLAHLFRECQYLNELDRGQEWSKSVESLFQEAIHVRNQKPTESINPQTWLDRLDKLIDENLSKLNEKFYTFKNGLLKCRDCRMEDEMFHGDTV